MRSGSMTPILSDRAAGWAARGAASARRGRRRRRVAFEAMRGSLPWARETVSSIRRRSETGSDVALEALEAVAGQRVQVLGVDEAQRQAEHRPEQPQLGAGRPAQVAPRERLPLPGGAL